MTPEYDAIVIGSGPNGLAAAIELAKRGAGVCVIERGDTFGGGVRSGEPTLPGYLHDICSAAHPMGILSPCFNEYPLSSFGLEWIEPPASVAHPLVNDDAAMLYRDVNATAELLGDDGDAWKRMVAPFVPRFDELLGDMLGPLSIPKHPFRMARFGLGAIRSAAGFARSRFKGRRAQAFFAGNAGHSILPFEAPLSAAIGYLFSVTGHVVNWPVARGGSQRIADALCGYFESLGGTLISGQQICGMSDLPSAHAYLFDTDPYQLASICEDSFPSSYVRRLRKFRFGPGVFKLDWALDGPIPWSDPKCLEASTVHVGGTLEEIAASERAAWRGDHSARPFLILCQQSQFDDSRAPEGKHTGYAYCHVPNGSTEDMTDAIESQVERFAPGFRDCILARHGTSTRAFEEYNPNYVGGAITGGAADMFQLFTRPVARINPYTTPDPRIFICSASTPPGGGVHGMCGYHAAKAAWKRIERQRS